jgi:hypothetical protein
MTTVAPHSRFHVRLPGRRLLSIAPAAAFIVVMAADVGSVALVKMSVPDDAADAARAGVGAIQFTTGATPENAKTAFDAAKQTADLHHLDLDTQTFTIFKDGSVKLTAHKNAPTLLFKRLPWLKDHTSTTSTVTVSRASW